MYIPGRYKRLSLINHYSPPQTADPIGLTRPDPFPDGVKIRGQHPATSVIGVLCGVLVIAPVPEAGLPQSQAQESLVVVRIGFQPIPGPKTQQEENEADGGDDQGEDNDRTGLVCHDAIIRQVRRKVNTERASPSLPERGVSDFYEGMWIMNSRTLD